MSDAARHSWQERLASDSSVRAIGLILRVAAVLLGVLVASFQGALGQSWPTAVALTGLALVVDLARFPWSQSAWWAIAELAVAGAILGLQDPLSATFLPYLLVAAATVGVRRGLSVGLAAVGSAAVTLIATQGLAGGGIGGESAALMGEWLLLSALGVIAGSWSRAWQSRWLGGSDRYQVAYRLLIRLRDLTRRLPAGLDQVTAAETVLDLIKRECPFDRGAVLRIEDDGPAQPLAVAGGESIPWYPQPESWLMRRIDGGAGPAQSMVWLEPDPHPEEQSTAFGNYRAFRAILPITLDDTRIGLVIMQRAVPWSDDSLAAAQHIVDDSALMLDTSFVFDDIRTLATSEERRRLAREIHDGIAQEIAGLAYVVDDITSREPDADLRADLDDVRTQLTRMVSELRLSIFELRTGVEQGVGLGASMSGYVRQVGARAGMTVHLVLEEGPARLPADVEVEVLRIVQESVTNARRHSAAKNLWVTLRTAAPKATVRIADDGVGLTDRRSDSYGLEIMRERATRIGGRLDVRPRVGGGTVVELTVGESTPLDVRLRDTTRT